jgi:hypothetical protein
MKRFLLPLILLCGTLSIHAQKNEISTATELKRLSAIEDLPLYIQQTAVKQFSSYDTTGNNDDGFSGKYSFIRKNTDGSLVLFEDKGNGVINRIWTPTPTDDIFDFYFGGSSKPQYSIKFSDLFSGKVYPFIAPLTGNELGGYYCYFPITYKNGCKIVSRGKKVEFYQVQYRSYPKNSKITGFSDQLDVNAKSELSSISDKWKNISNPAGTPLVKEAMLSPAQSVTLAELNEGGRITGIRLKHSDVFRGLNKQVSIRVTWDNEKTPAIFMPVADFFGYAFGKESMQSLLLGSADSINYCYFPMPFSRNAKIELVYQTPDQSIHAAPIKIDAEIYVSDKQYNPGIEGKFYAFWNPDKKTTAGEPHLFLKGKGKGHYVGTILQAQGLNPGMTLFFEGDDVTRIDGELRMHGTGSEDYFNGGWYAMLDRWDRKMSLPLHGSLDYSLPFARTGGYRLFISDKMSFEKEITHTIEHGPENNNMPGDYTSVALYYAGKHVHENQQSPTDNSLLSVYLPTTYVLYPQLVQCTISGQVKIDGNVIQTTNGGQVKIDFSELPKGRYKLYADVEKNTDGAEFSIWQRQKLISEPISFYSEKKEHLPKTYLCEIDLDDFRNAITLHIKQDAAKSVLLINKWILIRAGE